MLSSAPVLDLKTTSDLPTTFSFPATKSSSLLFEIDHPALMPEVSKVV